VTLACCSVSHACLPAWCVCVCGGGGGVRVQGVPDGDVEDGRFVFLIRSHYNQGGI
jgi:hypothetical protein